MLGFIGPKYDLGPDEAMLLKEESVRYSDSFWAGHTDVLMLTSRNLVLIRKGTFGNGKEMMVFPLNQIKVFNDQVQAMLSKDSRGWDALEIYFRDGTEIFVFQSGGKKKIHEWIAKINLAITGTEVPIPTLDSSPYSGIQRAAGRFRDALIGSKSVSEPKPQPKPEVRISRHCQGCGAPISGVSGGSVTCAYCDTAQQI